MDALPGTRNVDLTAINQLEADILARVGRPGCQPQLLPTDLEARRHKLLASHLGFEPASPLPRLYVMGDSHAAFFAGTEQLRFYKGRRVVTGFFRIRRVNVFTELLPVFRVFHLGAATAWNADEPAASTRAREKIQVLLRRDIPSQAALLLVFGEIDCRWQIPQTVLNGKNVAAATQATVDRFMTLPRRLKQEGYRVAIWQPSGVTVAEETPAGVDHPRPTRGSLKLRLEIARQYSERLVQACAATGIPCPGIIGRYHSWDEPAAAECFIDQCHLSQRMMPIALAALNESGVLPLRPSL